MRILCIAGSILICLGGCTTVLTTEHVSTGRAPVPGILYNLPMAAFDVDAKILITGCKYQNGSVAVLTHELIDGTVRHRLISDELETYRIRYDELNSPMKITSAKVSLHSNGMIKSINVELEDRTAQVMQSLTGAAINLFKAAALVAVPTTLPKGAERCDEFISKRIEDRFAIIKSLPEARADDKALTGIQDDVDEIAAKLEEAKTKAAEAEKAKNTTEAASLKKQIAALQAQWKIANAKLSGKSMRVPKLQARLAALTDELTVPVSIYGWAPRKSSKGNDICETISVNQVQFLQRLASISQDELTRSPDPKAVFAADVCVEMRDDARMAPAASDEVGVEAIHEGVVYRLPAFGSVVVKGRGSDGTNEGTVFRSTPNVTLPQFGAKGLVWLRNKAFDKNNVSALFNEDGTMSELLFHAESQAERAAAAAADTSKALVDLMQLRADAIKAKAQAADEAQKKAQQQQIDEIDAQIKLLNKRKELESARAPGAEALDRDKELLQKQIDVETLRQQYETLKRKGNSS